SNLAVDDQVGVVGEASVLESNGIGSPEFRLSQINRRSLRLHSGAERKNFMMLNVLFFISGSFFLLNYSSCFFIWYLSFIQSGPNHFLFYFQKWEGPKIIFFISLKHMLLT